MCVLTMMTNVENNETVEIVSVTPTPVRNRESPQQEWGSKSGASRYCKISGSLTILLFVKQLDQASE